MISPFLCVEDAPPPRSQGLGDDYDNLHSSRTSRVKGQWGREGEPLDVVKRGWDDGSVERRPTPSTSQLFSLGWITSNSIVVVAESMVQVCVGVTEVPPYRGCGGKGDNVSVTQVLVHYRNVKDFVVLRLIIFLSQSYYNLKTTCRCLWKTLAFCSVNRQ